MATQEADRPDRPDHERRDRRAGDRPDRERVERPRRAYKFTGDGVAIRHNVVDPEHKKRRVVKPGEIVLLTDVQAKAFRDRFVPVEVESSDKPSTPAPPPPEGDRREEKREGERGETSDAPDAKAKVTRK